MKRFSKVLLTKMILVVVLSISIIGILWISQEYIRFNREMAEMRSKEHTARKQTLVSHVNHVCNYIDFKRSQAESKIKKSVKSRVEEAHAIANTLWETNKSTLPAEDIQLLVKKTLGKIRFNNGRGYFFAFSTDGINQLHPVQPELEGQNLKDLKDHQGKLIVRDMTELVKNQGEGFYQYQWSKPGRSETDFNKISYVKIFKPFDWFIGTGDYIDDMELSIQEEVLEMINSIKFGNDGSVFAAQWDGVSLTGPEKGKNVYDLTDPNGVKFIQELITQSRNGGGFVSYILPGRDNQPSTPELSYARGIEKWEWFISAGMSLDDIERNFSISRAAMSRSMFQNISQTTLVLLVLVVLAVIISISTSIKIQRVFDSFYTFFQNAEKAPVEIDTSQFKYVEFRQMAEAANKMMARLKESRQELLISNEKFTKIFQNSPDAILMSSFEDGRIIEVNNGYEKMSGYTREESLGKNSIDLNLWVNPDDRNFLYKHLETHGAARNMETTLRVKSGEIRHGLLSAESIDISGDKFLVIIVTDITELKTAHKRLQKSQERLSRIFNSSPMGIHIYELNDDNQLIFTGANHAANKILKTDHNRLIGKSILDAFPDLENTSVKEKYTQICIQGTPWESDNINYQDTTFQIHAFQTEPGKMATFFLDITDRMEAEKEKELLESQLRQAQKVEAIGTLAGGIAHDFNNILTPLLLHTEMVLYDLPSNSDIRPHLTEVLDAGHRAKKLVRQILEFSRKGEQKRYPVKLTSVCKEVIQFIRASIPTTIEIKHNLFDQSYILADPIQIHQVILNLCTNAAYAMKHASTGLLEINLTREAFHGDNLPSLPELTPGIYLKLSVRDTGHGMTRDVRLRIFDPFFTTKEQGEGTGLGLSVVHGILISHGGGIDVSSAPGQGSTFTVYLPLLQEQALENKREEEPLPAGSGRILLVDDEKKLVQAEQQILTKLGYTVTPISDSREALDLFRNNPESFDLVMTDLVMPGITGIHLIKEILAIRIDIPIIISSGYFNQSVMDEAQSLGITKLLAKPVTMRTMATAINDLLEDPKKFN